MRKKRNGAYKEMTEVNDGPSGAGGATKDRQKHEP